VRAGRLRHRVQLQGHTNREDARDSYGGVTVTWNTLATVWAAVEPAGGREQYRTQAERAELTHLVVVRYRPDLTPVDRVVLGGGRALDVEAVVNPGERNRELHLLCRENVP